MQDIELAQINRGAVTEGANAIRSKLKRREFLSLVGGAAAWLVVYRIEAIDSRFAHFDVAWCPSQSETNETVHLPSLRQCSLF
jgi:hypothetical protein